MWLPRILDDYIFNELHAVYKIDPGAVKRGQLGIENYLGTYFPRSFVESYLIFKDLFMLPEVQQNYQDIDEISILDIGTGTGGQILGLLWLLDDIGILAGKTVNIVCIDADGTALERFRDIIGWRGWAFKIRYITHNFSDTDDIWNTIMRETNNESFDFLLSSKFCCELYFNRPEDFYGLYNKMFEIFNDKIRTSGFAIVLDTTDKNRDEDSSSFIPMIMTKCYRKFLRENSSSARIKCILPLSCAYWGIHCTERACFRQKVFDISHTHRENDISRVVYYVFTSNENASNILNYNNIGQTYITGGVKDCSCGSLTNIQRGIGIDAFSFHEVE